MSTRIGSRTLQQWLGTTHPRLADACDRIPQLGMAFSDIIEGIATHVEAFGCDPADYRPSATIESDGTIILDLAPVGGVQRAGDVFAAHQAQVSKPAWEEACAFMCDQIPGLADVFAEVAQTIEAHASVNGHDVREYNPEAYTEPGDGHVILELNPPVVEEEPD